MMNLLKLKLSSLIFLEHSLNTLDLLIVNNLVLFNNSTVLRIDKFNQ